MKKSELKQMISSLVAEELRKQLPTLISTVLAEQFLTKIVREAVSRKGPERPQGGLTEVLSDVPEEDTIPSPMSNTGEGIYDESPLFRNESRQSLRSSVPAVLRDPSRNPLSFIYEDLQIPDESVSAPVAPLPPVDFSHAAKVVEKLEERRTSSASPEERMQEVERRRRLLEVPVG